MADEADEVEKLYEYGERLNEAQDKSQRVEDFEGIINAAKGSSVKAKQLAAQLIPRFSKFFPSLALKVLSAQIDLVEEDDLRIRIQAIRGFPLLCKDEPDFISKVVDILGQLLLWEETVERDAVHQSLISLLRQDAKASLTALFKHIEAGQELIRERIIFLIRDKVFPLKAELLRPQEEMERHFTDLVKKSLQDVTGAEFKLFMDFLMSFKIFGDNAPPERLQELIEIIEGQADLNAQFDITDNDHIDRLSSCMYMALPFFMRGASSSKFFSYFSKQILPVFDKFSEERKLDLLKTLAGCSPFAAAQDSRNMLPSIVQLLKKYMPLRRTEEAKFNYIECLLYAFHHFACKTPNTTNSLCGYKIVTGQPSDRLGENFSDNFKDFTERLTCVEELVKSSLKKLTQGMSEHRKALSSAKTDDAKSKIKSEQLSANAKLRICNNIIELIKPLHSKSPSFIGDKKVTLSWEPAKTPQALAGPAAGNKRALTAAANGSNTNLAKKGRGGIGGVKNQLVNRAFEGLGPGGRNNVRGRNWGGRGRGRGYR